MKGLTSSTFCSYDIGPGGGDGIACRRSEWAGFLPNNASVWRTPLVRNGYSR